MSDEQGILQTLQELKVMVAALVERAEINVKAFYEVGEFARLIGKTADTVRDYCRSARLHATKKNSGRGKFLGWSLSHAELVRFQKEGLLPKAMKNGGCD